LAIDAKARSAPNIPNLPLGRSEPRGGEPRANAEKPGASKFTGGAAPQSAAKDSFASPQVSAGVSAPAQSEGAPVSAALASSSSAIPASATADAATGRTPPVSAQVGREIIRRSTTGSTRFEMRLDPPGLGRVDVRLEVSRDHRVTAVISADNPQALNELSKGARDLQLSLQQAGLDLSDDGLSFDLSQHQNAFAQTNSSEQQQRGPNGPQTNNPAATAETAPVASRPLSIDSWRGGRVDLMA
jgi:flagellar hook-length control protein FliK